MVDLDTLSALCKRRGFVYPSSEIYGGFGGFWDYGPLGTELKKNIKEAWWRSLVQLRQDVVGLDSAIVMNPAVWVATGHVKNFVDRLVECKQCKQRFREEDVENNLCPNCNVPLSEARLFNTMFRTFVGPVEDEAAVAYLRPETAQGIFADFKNVLASSRKKLPFGVAQIGKAFRNEITPGKFIFRLREFEQMELEFFIQPDTDDKWFPYWVNQRVEWYKQYGMNPDNIKLLEYPREELAFYSKATTDVLFHFPFGWSELEGIADRTDYDLKRHIEHSGEDLSYFDEETGQRIVPWVIEPSVGVDRLFLAFLLNAYGEEQDKEGTRVVLRLHPRLAPFKVAVLPLSKKEPLAQKAEEVSALLRPHFMTTYDETQSIGRRYRRQDEIGTPWCVTVDFQSLEDHAVTIRDRDTMTQERVPIAELVANIRGRLEASLS
ncbi:MAG TPA: glycine--tRNA ligase [Chloroflexota bacterium]|nr:glycine--tRNA ligase [Chloroflexota bacterium]